MQDQFILDPNVTPSIQLRAIRAILSRVAEAVQAGKKPVVELDLDLTSLLPSVRTRYAARVAGERFQVPELLEVEKLGVLPGYTTEAWTDFVQRTQLATKYPDLRWGGAPDATGAAGGVYATFHTAFWATELLADDVANPGLGAFVRAVEGLGGVVVFISGRWLEEQFGPSREALRRAGVPEPNLEIGNPRHGDLVKPGEKPLSDAEIKALRQPQIREKYGIPVAIVDDRLANRDAVIAANKEPVLGIGVAIPGFSHDPATNAQSLRISTFETFELVSPDPKREPYLYSRYPELGLGLPWRGEYQGLARNGRSYVARRVMDPALDGAELGAGFPFPFASLVHAHKEGSLAVDALMEAAIRTIPDAERVKLHATLAQAEELASLGKAAPYPETEEDRRHLWYTLVTSWLHARDLEVLLGTLGFPLATTGVHDLVEEVPTDELKATIAAKRRAGASYSPWFNNWVESLPNGKTVNIGFLNAELTVSTWRWHPDVPGPQDAMDAHRLSSHHEGDGKDRLDPFEAAMNELLHHREGVYGVRKEEVRSFETLATWAGTERGAEDLGKNGVANGMLRDAIPVLKKLEASGRVTPWGLVRGASF